MTLEQATEILKEAIEEDGGLHSLGHYMAYWSGKDTIVLDDRFSLEELEAIVVWMKAHALQHTA